jgi:threonine/homoserine/homoserine lactone efflux protein
MVSSSIIAFWVVAALLIVVPGADWAFTIGSALRGHAVVAAVGGLVVGYAGLTVVVAAGVGALVAETPTALTVLTVVGGSYLMWHGVRTVLTPSSLGSTVGAPTGTNWGTLVQGIGVSGLNPKGLLLFLALLPQFTNAAGSWPVAAQIVVLGAVFILSCGAFYLCLGAFARTILRTRSGVARAVSRFSGAAMVVVGGLLIADRLIT